MLMGFATFAYEYKGVEIEKLSNRKSVWLHSEKHIFIILRLAYK